MKIAMFSESYAPSLNGPALAVGALYRELGAMGEEVHVFTAGRGEVEERVYRSTQLPVSQGYGPSVPYFKESARLAQMDVYHTHQPFVLGLYALRKARKYGKKLIFTYHCRYGEYAKIYLPLGSILAGPIDRYVGWFANRCDAVILPSAQLKDFLIGCGVKEEKVHVIPNGIPLTAREAVAREEALVAYAGRVAGEKDIGFLLRMYVRLAQRMPEARLRIIGGGPALPQVQHLAHQLGLGVAFTGYVPHEELLRQVARASVFVSGSMTEVHPLTLLEAMHEGAVPVARRSPGFADVITDGTDGLLVEGEEEAFARAVEGLLRDHTRLTLMRRAAQQTAARYDIARTAAQVRQLYRHTIGSA